MDSDRDAATIGRVLRILAAVVFAGVAGILSFVLVFMSSSPDWTPLYGTFSSGDYAIPVTMGLGALLSVAVSIVVPRLALLSMRRRIDGPTRLEHYATARFCASAVLAVGVLLFGFVGAFMVQDLVYWGVGVLIGLVPVILAWPTRRRRARWAGDIHAVGGA